MLSCNRPTLILLFVALTHTACLAEADGKFPETTPGSLGSATIGNCEGQAAFCARGCRPPQLSGRSPVHFPVDEPCPTELARIMWRAFTSMVWHADLGTNPADVVPSQRGVPKNPDDCEGKDSEICNELRCSTEDRPCIGVWQTWKQDWEIFNRNPTDWNSYIVQEPPCDEIVLNDSENKVIKVEKEDWPRLFWRHGNGTLLNKISQFKHFPEDSKFPFRVVGPLTDRNSSVIYSEVRYNKEFYECLIEGQPGCRVLTDFDMPKTTTEKTGAIVARASWSKVPMLSRPDRERFLSQHHTQNLLVLDYRDGGAEGSDANKKTCRREEYALVGLGISLKSAKVNENGVGKQNQWIFSTFLRDQDVSGCQDVKFNPSLLPPDYKMAAFSYPLEPVCPEPLHDPREPTKLCRLSELSQRDKSGINNEFYRGMLPQPWNYFTSLDINWMEGRTSVPGTGPLSHPILEAFAQETNCMNCHDNRDNDQDSYISRFDHVISLALAMNQNCQPVADVAESCSVPIFPFGSTWIPWEERMATCGKSVRGEESSAAQGN